MLRATERFWSRYHTWGSVTAESVGPSTCTLVVQGSPGQELLCALLEGSFARIADLTGATDVSTQHTECVADGHDACKFVIGWQETGAAAVGGAGEKPPSSDRAKTTPVR